MPVGTQGGGFAVEEHEAVVGVAEQEAEAEADHGSGAMEKKHGGVLSKNQSVDG
jgi:hypothetical protein